MSSFWGQHGQMVIYPARLVGALQRDIRGQEDFVSKLLGTDHVCLRVQMLEGHQIQELGLGRVVHHDLRQAQNALLEADVFEAAAAAPLELDASLVQLRG
ncbi:hypothetical protein ACLOJK_025731 [Asimina triloba]